MKLEKEIICDNEFCLMWCIPQKRLIQHQWRKFCYGEEFKSIMTAGAETFRKYKCIKWMSDNRNFSAMHPDDMAWGLAHWAPKMLKVGWKFHAMVLPEKVVGQISSKSMLSWFEERGIRTRIFSDPEEASAWLEEKGTLGLEISVPET